MIRRQVRATLVALPLFAVLIGLGVWQLQRLAWKEDLLARLQAGLEAPALVNPDLAAVPEFTHIRLDGHYIPGKSLRLYGRTLDGVAGIHDLRLFQSVKGPVMVDRGFVALTAAGQEPLVHEPTADSVEGVVRRANGRGLYEAENSAAKNEWFWIDLPAMLAALGAEPAGTAYIETTTPPPATAADPTPTGGLILAHIRNDHLQYALTWFALAGVLVAIWGISLRQKRPDALP
jgi:surfeit locus 1 family protein